MVLCEVYVLQSCTNVNVQKVVYFNKTVLLMVLWPLYVIYLYDMLACPGPRMVFVVVVTDWVL